MRQRENKYWIQFCI